jgi:uncharacterized membrane protein (Fun14 family)
MFHHFKNTFLQLNDEPYSRGGLLGFLTTIPYLIIDFLLCRIWKGNPIPLYSSTLVISHTGYSWDYVFGILSDLTAGSLMGFIIGFIIEKTSYRYLAAKGLVIGSTLWILHVSVIPKLWEPGLLKLMNRPTVYIAWLTHILWGLGFGAILGYLEKQRKNNHK